MKLELELEHRRHPKVPSRPEPGRRSVVAQLALSALLVFFRFLDWAFAPVDAGRDVRVKGGLATASAEAARHQL